MKKKSCVYVAFLLMLLVKNSLQCIRGRKIIAQVFPWCVSFLPEGRVLFTCGKIGCGPLSNYAEYLSVLVPDGESSRRKGVNPCSSLPSYSFQYQKLRYNMSS